ncbi:hypothetical protein, partial [Devosia indica]
KKNQKCVNKKRRGGNLELCFFFSLCFFRVEGYNINFDHVGQRTGGKKSLGWVGVSFLEGEEIYKEKAKLFL